jgi:exonuclease SbcC
MLDLTLESLTVQDFRSIRGRVVVPVGAPVVLIHGANGAGKSSLISALALALGGSAVQGLASPKHLVHHGAKFASVELGTSDGPHSVRIAADDTALPGGVLDPKAAAFFAERCYLEQATLTRLLDLYQQESKEEADSALTRFVKELLRLDEVDALIEGLHIAGHVQRVRNHVPAFARTEEQVAERKHRAVELKEQRVVLEAEIARLRNALRAGLANVDVEDVPEGTPPAEDDPIQRWLEDDRERADVDRLEALVRRVGDLERRWGQVKSTAETRTTRDAEAAEAAARERHERWREAHGKALDAALKELRQDFPQLPSIDSTPPSDAYDAAILSLDAGIMRLGTVLAEDAETIGRLAEAEADAARARERLDALDRELADDAAVTELGTMAAALADLAPHITDDHCPVCGRDFSEVSDRPLSAHLAEEIARLGAQASRLQAVAKARLETTTDLQRSEATAALLHARRLPSERRNGEEARRKRLVVLRERLLQHERGAREGGAIMRNLVDAQSALSRAHSRDRANVDLSEEVDQLVAEASPESEVADRTPAELLAGLRASLATDAETVRRHRDRRVESAELRRALIDRVRDQEAITVEQARVAAELKERSTALDEAKGRMMRARALLHDVESIRRSIVSGVFNSALNDVWADLFIRLAPDEPYVPAFCEPDDAGPVTARLETRRRDGSRGGSPRDMLSAGNLNTAALTLFLALHLSVNPHVPWLLLDDPVQSMDEIHVSQFAALLRTLTQQHRRRVFIAVHERALFEYLALQLSPATSEGGLVTAQLRRERDDHSSVDVNWREFTPDTAVGAA